MMEHYTTTPHLQPPAPSAAASTAFLPHSSEATTDEHASIPPAAGAWLCRTDESQQRRYNTDNPLCWHLTR